VKKLIVIIIVLVVTVTGCASLTEEAMTPIALSFSDGSTGKCKLQNKRGIWEVDLPATVLVRRSDDALKYDSETEDGRTAVGMIPSEVGAKLYASIFLLDLGITDAITDKHRKYTPSFVIPVRKEAPKNIANNAPSPQQETVEPSDKNIQTGSKDELLLWVKVKEKNTTDMYEIYLSMYPNGIFAEDAQKKLNELGIEKQDENIENKEE